MYFLRHYIKNWHKFKNGITVPLRIWKSCNASGNKPLSLAQKWFRISLSALSATWDKQEIVYTENFCILFSFHMSFLLHVILYVFLKSQEQRFIDTYGYTITTHIPHKSQRAIERNKDKITMEHFFCQIITGRALLKLKQWFKLYLR